MLIFVLPVPKLPHVASPLAGAKWEATFYYAKKARLAPRALDYGQTHFDSEQARLSRLKTFIFYTTSHEERPSEGP